MLGACWEHAGSMLGAIINYIVLGVDYIRMGEESEILVKFLLLIHFPP